MKPKPTAIEIRGLVEGKKPQIVLTFDLDGPEVEAFVNEILWDPGCQLVANPDPKEPPR